mgnify:CR=1 FL=1
MPHYNFVEISFIYHQNLGCSTNWGVIEQINQLASNFFNQNKRKEHKDRDKGRTKYMKINFVIVLKLTCCIYPIVITVINSRKINKKLQ